MKKLILIGLMSAGIASGAFAQGQIYFDNGLNTSNSPTATSGGLIFLNGALLNQDVNAQLYGGSSASTMVLLSTLLLSDGTAAADVTGIGSPGILTDLSGTILNVNTGGVANGTAFFQV